MGGSMPRVRRRAGPRHRYLDSTTTVDTSIKRTYPLPSLSGWVKHSFSFSSFYGANPENGAFDRDGVLITEFRIKLLSLMAPSIPLLAIHTLVL